jgi:hypothetical protein
MPVPRMEERVKMKRTKCREVSLKVIMYNLLCLDLSLYQERVSYLSIDCRKTKTASWHVLLTKRNHPSLKLRGRPSSQSLLPVVGNLYRHPDAS